MEKVYTLPEAQHQLSEMLLEGSGSNQRLRVCFKDAEPWLLGARVINHDSVMVYVALSAFRRIENPTQIVFELDATTDTEPLAVKSLRLTCTIGTSRCQSPLKPETNLRWSAPLTALLDPLTRQIADVALTIGPQPGV